MKRQIAKQLNGDRRQSIEFRNELLESPQNERLWVAYTAGALVDFEATVVKQYSTGTNEFRTRLGDTDAMTMTSAITEIADAQYWQFNGYKETFKFTNVGEHNIYFRVTEFVCNQTRPTINGIPDIASTFMKDVDNSINTTLSDGTHADTATLVEAQALMGTLSANQLSTYSSLMRPQNRNLSKLWKRKKTRFIKLGPGDSVYYRMKIPFFNFDRYKYVQEQALTRSEAPTLIKGITKAMMIDFHGQLGKNDTANTVGWTIAQLGVERISRVTCLPMLNAKRFKHMEITLDDLTGVTLEGPTQHIQQDEND